MEASLESQNFFTVKFNGHTRIDEKEPFILYSISVKTIYSSFNICKRYSDFSRLNEELITIREEWTNSGFVQGLTKLPKFPSSSLYYWNLDEDFIQERK